MKKLLILLAIILIFSTDCGLFAQSAKKSYIVGSPRYKKAERLMREGNELGRKKKYKEAIKKFQSAIELISDNSQLWYNLGLTYYNMGNEKKAYDAWQKTLKINPKNADGWFNLGLIYSKRRESLKALFHFSRVIELEPTNVRGQERLTEEYLLVFKRNLAKLKKMDASKAKKLLTKHRIGNEMANAGSGEHPLANQEIPGMGKNFKELLEMFKKIPFGK